MTTTKQTPKSMRQPQIISLNPVMLETHSLVTLDEGNHLDREDYDYDELVRDLSVMTGLSDDEIDYLKSYDVIQLKPGAAFFGLVYYSNDDEPEMFRIIDKIIMRLNENHKQENYRYW